MPEFNCDSIAVLPVRVKVIRLLEECKSTNGFPAFEIPILATSAFAKSRLTQRPDGVPSGVFSKRIRLESESIAIIEGLPRRGVLMSIPITGWSKSKSINSQSLSDIIVKTGPKASPRVKSLDE